MYKEILFNLTDIKNNNVAFFQLVLKNSYFISLDTFLLEGPIFYFIRFISSWQSHFNSMMPITVDS